MKPSSKRRRASGNPTNTLSPFQKAALPSAKEELLELLLAEQGYSACGPVAIKPRDKTGNPPLSFAQQRLWFLDQLVPGNPFYNVAAAVRLAGRVNVPALERSFNEIVRRHESLRTTFAVVGEQPVQIIAPSTTLRLAIEDLSDHPAPERLSVARSVAAEEARRRFDLSRGPLFRVKLLLLAEEQHVLILTMHHIVSDGWSMGILVRELSALYGTFSDGQTSPLAELPIQYADFACWQCERLQGEVLASQLSYWSQQLAGASTLVLPYDRPRPGVQTFHGASLPISLPASLTKALKAFSQRERVTLFMLLLTAFKVMLHRYSGQTDIIVGTPIANRNWAELEGLIGFFVNTLALRTDVSCNPTFLELLNRVREVTQGAYDHQDLPFERLVEELHPERETGRNPLVQVVFALQNAPVPVTEFSGLTLAPVDLEMNVTRFDLELHLSEVTDKIAGTFTYSTDLFDSASIARMAGHYRTLLESIVTDPRQRIAQLPIMPAGERAIVLEQWNETATAWASPATVRDMVRAQVALLPDAVAVDDGSCQLSYGAIHCQARKVAARLRRLGVGPEQLAAVCFARSSEVMIALLGVIEAGAVYLPVDASLPQQRRRRVLQAARVSVVLTQPELASELAGDWELFALDSKGVPVEHGAGADPCGDPEEFLSERSLAYVVYTSGTTGDPKGVAVEHRGLANLVRWHQSTYGVGVGESMSQVASLSFDAAVWEIWSALTSGARLVIANDETRVNPTDLVRWLERNAITVSFLPTPLWEAVKAEEWQSVGRAFRLVLTGGDRLQRHPAVGLSFRLVNHYGPSENSVVATAGEMSGGTEGTPSIGTPIANQQVYLLDPSGSGEPVPMGVVGELYIGGNGLARGYLHQAQLTAEKFVPSRFSSTPGQRLYRTGDLARYLPTGRIAFIGRRDQQIKLRGRRIELGEIEAALSRHPKVHQAVAALQETAAGEKHLAAYIVAAEPVPAAGELRAHLKQQLPEYMIPSSFLLLQAFPLTTNGKVDRAALSSVAARPLGSDSTCAAPRTKAEQTIAAIWQEVLHLDRVNVQDNFFDVGGHSLLMTQIQTKLQEAFRKEIPLLDLFRYPMVSSLASHLAGDVDEESKRRRGIDRAEVRRASEQRRRHRRHGNRPANT